jgi:regulator of replication initiation timing
MSISIPEINIADIKDRNLAEQIEKLLNVIELLFAENERLQKENRELRDEIAKLKKQAKRPVFSSTDYSATKRDINPKPKWKKGKKKGTIHIDRVVELEEVKKCICGCKDFLQVRTVKKVVQDIVITTANTQYTGTDKKCRKCGKIYKAPLPNEIKGVQYGTTLRSWVSCLKFDFRMSEGLIHRFVTEVGIQISKGQLSNIILQNGKKLTLGFTHLIVEGIKKSSYIQTDATMHKRKKTIYSQKIAHNHLHFIGHQLLSIFKITKRYNTLAIHTIIGKRARKKPMVSDDASSYGNKFTAQLKQLCWIHEIRHYLKLCPIVKRHKIAAGEVLKQIWEWYEKAKVYKDFHTEEQKRAIEEQFEQITTQKTGYRELDHRLALTYKKKERLLLFLKYPFLPIQNNQSERDVREAVLIRTISRETKSDLGDRSLEKHLSIIQTARKQELNVFNTVHGLLTGTLSPSVLTTKTI